MNGIPEGYEFVRVGRAMAGETVLAASGTPLTLVKDSMMRNCVVIRKVKPNCEFPRGVFKDGWITHDIKGACWWSRKPEWSTTSQQWTGNCPPGWNELGYGIYQGALFAIAIALIMMLVLLPLLYGAAIRDFSF